LRSPSVCPPIATIQKGISMKTVIFNTPEAAFNFTEKELKEQIESKISSYEIDETKKIMNMISNSHQETVVITEDQVFFDIIALNLIGAGKGTALCKSCNETYQAKDLNTIIIGSLIVNMHRK
jgi:hypothetical protein